MSDPIYLDYNATTPVAPEVADAVGRALRDAWGNPSSAHAYGRAARDAIETARRDTAALIGGRPDEVVFTSGGTEADNAAVLGVAAARERDGRHVVVSAVEHAAVERPCALLERRGWRVTRLPVDASGRIDPDRAIAALADDTVLVSVMLAQNETGVLQPVAAIAREARRRGITVHSDAAQAIGKIDVDVESLGVDLVTIAGHKLYAPKGVGALWVRRDTPFEPVLLGAGHEGGRRAGTENVPGIVGLGAACRLAATELPERTRILAARRDRLEAALRERIPELVVHGADAPRLPNTASVALPGTSAVAVLERSTGVAAGGGAACHSGVAHVSPVLRAMGVPEDLALATVRLCVGRSTSADDVERAAAILADAARAPAT